MDSTYPCVLKGVYMGFYGFVVNRTSNKPLRRMEGISSETQRDPEMDMGFILGSL